MFYDKKDYHIFGANLYGLTDDATINPKLSKAKNIQKAIMNRNIEKLEFLYLKKTMYRNLYQEIITGTMIPAFRDIILFDTFQIAKGPKNSAFIIVPEKMNGYRTIYLNHLSRYEMFKISSYYNEHPDANVFAQELQDIFEQSEQNYTRLLNKK